jgi:2-polyprenyl-6-methoxyphenol hydroxylase-like FAD-dependent oxidoreductase
MFEQSSECSEVSVTTALVIGAGIAGPVTAMALQRAGVEAVVCEARPEETDEAGPGVFLTLQVNGIDALRALDVDVAGLGFASPTIRLRSGSGRLLGEVGTGAPLPDGTTGVVVRRAELHRALQDEARRRGVVVHRGRRLVDAQRAGDGVRAVFADGSSATADLLVGADGVHSRVRRLIDPDAAAPRPVPLLDTGGFAPPQPGGGGDGSFEMVFGRRAFFGHGTAPDGSVWWFANVPHTGPRPPVQGWREHLLELFAPDRSPARAIIASTPADPVPWTTHVLPRVRRWHRDRMLVLGDAAHAAAPSSGQGASMAVEDAVQLGRCLRDLPDPDAAFAAFEGLRRRRVERVVAHGARTTSTKVAGPVGRVVRDALLPGLLRLGGGPPAWLHRHHVDWDEPVGAGSPAPRR